MNLSVQEIKNNLLFPVLPSEATSSDIVIPNEIINIFTNPDSELTIGEKFTDEEKSAILNYIDDLHLSSSAITEFNKITQPISIIPVQENIFQAGVLDSSQGEYPVILFDENFLNGNTEPIYISPDGTLHQFDLKLIFMHELIHVVTGLPDTTRGDNSVFDSPEKALGPTQEISNKIHKGYPVRI